MKEFTHIAEIYGIRCYYNVHTSEVLGTTIFRDWMIDIFVWLDTTFNISNGFKIVLIEEL